MKCPSSIHISQSDGPLPVTLTNVDKSFPRVVSRRPSPKAGRGRLTGHMGTADPWSWHFSKETAAEGGVLPSDWGLIEIIPRDHHHPVTNSWCESRTVYR